MQSGYQKRPSGRLEIGHQFNSSNRRLEENRYDRIICVFSDDLESHIFLKPCRHLIRFQRTYFKSADGIDFGVGDATSRPSFEKCGSTSAANRSIASSRSSCGTPTFTFMIKSSTPNSA